MKTQLVEDPETTAAEGSVIIAHPVKGGQYVKTKVRAFKNSSVWCFLPLVIDGRLCVQPRNKKRKCTTTHQHLQWELAASSVLESESFSDYWLCISEKLACRVL